LLVVEGQPYLVDTPNGVAGQLAKAGTKLDSLSQIFITHNHSDHVIDAGTLLVLAWGRGSIVRWRSTGRRRSGRLSVTLLRPHASTSK
jgi:ribonuclease BN (tRNA processing enzyme)